ncbi:TPA: hypothetical protein LU109_003583 [Enterobacter hormaechei subsp. xiangfangensis]|nr:hypothetical protein [Enterobacter hormaechei subsp. xiangfangensis]
MKPLYVFKHPSGEKFWSLVDESNKECKDVVPVYMGREAPAEIQFRIRNQYNGLASSWNTIAADQVKTALEMYPEATEFRVVGPAMILSPVQYAALAERIAKRIVDTDNPDVMYAAQRIIAETLQEPLE